VANIAPNNTEPLEAVLPTGLIVRECAWKATLCPRTSFVGALLDQVDLADSRARYKMILPGIAGLEISLLIFLGIWWKRYGFREDARCMTILG
jgi:hypothetical protein